MRRISKYLAACLFLVGASTAQTVYPKGTTILDESKVFDGYTLFAPPGVLEAVLINMQGDVVHTWSSPFAGEALSNVVPLDGGHILAFSDPPGSATHTALELDALSNVVWTVTVDPAFGYLHHDIQRMSNGNTLLLAAQEITVPSISPLPLIDDFILEVDPSGALVWAWYTWEHFDEFGFSDAQKQLISEQGGDWAHVNAVSGLPANSHTDPALAENNIIVSQRFTNIVFIIDRTTGQIVWQTGPDPSPTRGQHNPYMIGEGIPGAGNLMIFDNGSGTGYLPTKRAPGQSSILEMDPVTKDLVWSYDATKSGYHKKLFWSDIVSNAQRLPNGNTLICSGAKGRLFEVTNAGEIVWEYMSPYVQLTPEKKPLVYRAYRIGLDGAPPLPR